MSTGRGFSDAIKGVVSGFIITAMIAGILNLTNQKNDIGAIEGVNSLAGIIIIYNFESWGNGYLIGWLCATGILSALGLIDSSLFYLYLVIGALVLIGNLERQRRRKRRS